MNKKLLTAVLVPLMLMLVASFGYAQWTDSVAVNVAATTGDVEFRILAFGVCSQSGGLVFTGEGSYGEVDSISLTMDRTYPGCWAYFSLQVRNTGTISLKLYRMRIVYTGGNAGWMDYYYFAIPTGDAWCGMTAPVYFYNTLTWWSDWKYYGINLDAGLPNSPKAPGTVWVLGGYFKLADDAPQVESDTINVRLDLEAIQALP